MRFLLVVLALAGCVNVPGKTPLTNPLKSLATLTESDLKAAIAIAQAANPPDTEAVMCFTFLDTNLATLQSASTPAVAGAISAFEIAHLGVNSAGNFLSPAQKVGLEQACGPYALSVQGGVLALGNLMGVSVLALPK